jgi:hypothetical protein
MADSRRFVSNRKRRVASGRSSICATSATGPARRHSRTCPLPPGAAALQSRGLAGRSVTGGWPIPMPKARDCTSILSAAALCGRVGALCGPTRVPFSGFPG